MSVPSAVQVLRVARLLQDGALPHISIVSKDHDTIPELLGFEISVSPRSPAGSATYLRPVELGGKPCQVGSVVIRSL